MKKERSYSKGVILFSLERYKKHLIEEKELINWALDHNFENHCKGWQFIKESIQDNIDALDIVNDLIRRDLILPQPPDETFDFDEVAQFPFTDFGNLGGTGHDEETYYI